MEESYSVLARAMAGLADQLEDEINATTQRRREAATLLRQVCPDMSEAERSLRLQRYDAQNEPALNVVLRMRRVLDNVASRRSAGVLS